MPAGFKSYFLQLTLLTALLGILGYSIQHLARQPIMPSAFVQLLLFFYLVSAVIHFILLKATEARPKSFITYFMGVTGFKLLLYLGVLVIYVLFINREDAIPFVVAFLIFYVIYTAFETVALLKAVRKQ